MFQKLITFSAWALLAFIAYATVSPIENRPTLSTSSNFEHLAAFAFLGAMFCLAYPRQIVLVCVIVLGSGVLLELLQLLAPGRHGQILDALEKLAGGVMGIVAAKAILYFMRVSNRFQN